MILRLSLGFLCLAVASLPWSKGATSVALGASALSLIIFLWGAPRKLPTLSIPTALVLLSAIYSTYRSEFPLAAYQDVKGLWAIFAFFLAFGIARQGAPLKALPAIFLISAGLAGCYAFSEVSGWFGDPVLRSAGTLVLFKFTFLMALASVWSLFFLLSVPIKKSWVALFPLSGSLLGIVAEGSLSGIAALLSGLVFLTVLLFLLDKKKLLALPALLLLLLLIPTNQSKLLSAKLHSFNENLSNPVSSPGIRLALWKGSWNLFKESPFLGCGVGDFQKEFYALNPPVGRLDSSGNPHARFDHAHSAFFHLLATQGILGVTAFLCWFARLITRLWESAKERSPWAIASLLGIGTWLGMGISGGVLSSYFLAAMLIPCGVAIGLKEKPSPKLAAKTRV